MFHVFYDADLEVYLVQGQAECGEWLTFGRFKNKKLAYNHAERLEALALRPSAKENQESR